jgi:hypothetical protein
MCDHGEPFGCVRSNCPIVLSWLNTEDIGIQKKAAELLLIYRAEHSQRISWS